MGELVPLAHGVSQFQPHYSIADESQGQQYAIQQRYQPWTPDNTQVSPTSSLANEKASTSCKKQLNTKFFMSILVGLIICGVPLAAMSSLYVQKKNSPNATTSAGSSGNNNVNLPSQCTSYSAIADSSRLVSFTGCSGCIPDNSNYLPTGWYRFIGAGGTRLATMPGNSGSCGTSNPVWYNGTYPTTTASTISTTACIFYSSYVCYPSYLVSISITNCGGYFVFYLVTPTTAFGSARYCTTF